MKAVVYCDYGMTNLKLQEIEKPTPADDQVLVRVRAASLNPLDGHFVRGMLLARLMGGGLRKPKDTRLGVDYAGTVEAVGKNVTQFKPGDEVFGGRTGALAQYVVCARAEASRPKPANMTFEQAALSAWPQSPRCKACATRDTFRQDRRCSSMARPAASALSQCKLRNPLARK